MRTAIGMEVAFILMLLLTSPLAWGYSCCAPQPAMGILLALHLGVVFALFLTLPYSEVRTRHLSLPGARPLRARALAPLLGESEAKLVGAVATTGQGWQGSRAPLPALPASQDLRPWPSPARAAPHGRERAVLPALVALEDQLGAGSPFATRKAPPPAVFCFVYSSPQGSFAPAFFLTSSELMTQGTITARSGNREAVLPQHLIG